MCVCLCVCTYTVPADDVSEGKLGAPVVGLLQAQTASLRRLLLLGRVANQERVDVVFPQKLTPFGAMPLLCLISSAQAI